MLSIKAPAKINLSLDVIAERPDGYHEVDLIMQSIALADQLLIEPGEKLEISCSNPEVPVDRNNLVWRAGKILQEITGTSQGAKIRIEKRIPVAAGLAGGSADAAAALKGLNQLWGLGLSSATFLEIGLKLGADVPFCICGGTARARGIGEKLEPIASQLKSRVLLITPDLKVSTAFVYQRLPKTIRKHPDTETVIKALQNGDRKLLVSSWGNVLEEVTLKEYPEVANLKKILHGFGLNQVLMSGSGPTIFALDVNDHLVEKISAAIPDNWSIIETYF